MSAWPPQGPPVSPNIAIGGTIKQLMGFYRPTSLALKDSLLLRKQ